MHTHTGINTHKHAHMCLHACAHIHTLTHTCIHIQVWTHSHKHAHTCIHACAHICTRAHTRTGLRKKKRAPWLLPHGQDSAAGSLLRLPGIHSNLAQQAVSTALPPPDAHYLLNEQFAFQNQHLGCKNSDPGTYFKLNLLQNQNPFAIK